MSLIIIHRKSELFSKMGDLKILLNGNKIANISNGETKSFEIEKGVFTLQTKSFFVNSQIIKFNIGSNEKKAFVVSAFGKGYWKTFFNLREVKL